MEKGKYLVNPKGKVTLPGDFVPEACTKSPTELLFQENVNLSLRVERVLDPTRIQSAIAARKPERQPTQDPYSSYEEQGFFNRRGAVYDQ